jgi:hypothetical protein
MKLRSMLVALAACAVMSFALLTASAQAAPSPSQLGSHAALVKPAKVKKIKGAKYYNLYLDPFDYESGEYLGYHLEPPMFVLSKTHEWGLEVEPGEGIIIGTYESTKVVIKVGKEKEKYTYSRFYFQDVTSGDTYLFGYQTKTGWDDGEYVYEGEYAAAWYAEKS